MNKYKVLRYVALTGDIIYILWILYNGMDERFRNIFSVEAVVLIGLIFLLILNIILLFKVSPLSRQ